MTSTLMEISPQGHMQHKASLELTQVRCDVFKLWLSKLDLLSMNKSATKLRHDAQVWKYRDHAKTVSQKTLSCIDAKATSLLLFLPTAT